MARDATPNKVDSLVDALPEHINYRDVGCSWFSSCLGCPLPRCRFDDPGWVREEARRKRDRQIVRKCRIEGRSIQELAVAYSLSTRTILRILRRYSHD